MNLLRKYRLMFKEKSPGWYVFAKRDKPALLKGILYGRILKVMIGLTYRCQCACAYCGTAVYSKDREELSSQAFKDIIEKISRLSYFAVCISFFGGEPLLRPDIYELVKFCKTKGLLSEIDSNGLLLTKENVRKLKHAGLNHVFVTLDSIDQARHNAIKNKQGCFQAAVDGIKNCLFEGLSCSISLCATSENIDNGEIKRIIEFSRKLGVNSVRILPPVLVTEWTGKQDVQPLSEEQMDKLKNMLEPDFVYLESTKCNIRSAAKGCAAMFREFFYLSPYGEVQPCPYFPVSFGDISEESLVDILQKMWNHHLLVKFKDSLCPSNEPFIRDSFKKIDFSGRLPFKCRD